jgi:spermidine/putrescine-binding protein
MRQRFVLAIALLLSALMGVDSSGVRAQEASLVVILRAGNAAQLDAVGRLIQSHSFYAASGCRPFTETYPCQEAMENAAKEQPRNGVSAIYQCSKASATATQLFSDSLLQFAPNAGTNRPVSMESYTLSGCPSGCVAFTCGTGFLFCRKPNCIIC